LESAILGSEKADGIVKSKEFSLPALQRVKGSMVVAIEQAKQKQDDILSMLDRF